MDWSISDLQNFLDQNKYSERTLNGIKWTYFDIGEKNSKFVLVFLHGTMGNNEIFWLQLKFFKSKYRVISFNLPPIKGAEHLVDGIYENLKLNGVKKIVLIGTSFGGYLAQVFSSKYREMVDRLILSNTFITTQLYYQKYKFILWFEKIIPLYFIKRMMKKGLLAINHKPTREYLIDQLRNRMSKETLMARYISFIVNFSIEKAPIDKILIIETEEDPLVPFQLQIELKNSYPNAKVVTLSKDSNHFPYLTLGNEYNRILNDFLEK